MGFSFFYLLLKKLAKEFEFLEPGIIAISRFGQVCFIGTKKVCVISPK